MIRRMSDEPYPPIGDYALLGDMHSCALVSKSGSVDWCCWPRFDSPSVFGRLLDWEKGGHFQLAPRGVRSVSRRYVPGTDVLRATLATDSVVVQTSAWRRPCASGDNGPPPAVMTGSISRMFCGLL